MEANMVRMRVTIKGTRPLLQHQFGPDAIPLEKQERTGVAGHDPEEWKRTCMVTEDGRLYIRGDYFFSCLRAAAKYTKKGRGSIQPMLAATLQIEDALVLIDRHMPKEGDPKINAFGDPVYIDCRGVRNPATKGRNVRYRLAASPGWRCTFTILWDKTIVSREQMRAVLRDASVLVGLCDGVAIGMGRFAVLSCEELNDAEEAPAVGSVENEHPANRLEALQKEMPKVRKNGAA